jgi:hypothetical protein
MKNFIAVGFIPANDYHDIKYIYWNEKTHEILLENKVIGNAPGVVESWEIIERLYENVELF